MKKIILFFVLISLICTFSACTPNNSEVISENFSNDENITSENTIDKLNYIYGHFLIPLWNEGFYEISSYVQDDTGTNTLDLEYTLIKIDNMMKSYDEHKNYINSLDDGEYSYIKYIWSKIQTIIDTLYSKLKSETPTLGNVNYDFNTDNFSTYITDFRNEIDKIEENQ